MAKKKGMDALIGNIMGIQSNMPQGVKDDPSPNFPEGQEPEIKDGSEENRPSVERGTKPGETRATFIVRKEIVKKLQYMKLVSGVAVKDIVNEALEAQISKWENINGPITIPGAK
jgi:hypothetical protein